MRRSSSVIYHSFGENIITRGQGNQFNLRFSFLKLIFNIDKCQAYFRFELYNTIYRWYYRVRSLCGLSICLRNTSNTALHCIVYNNKVYHDRCDDISHLSPVGVPGDGGFWGSPGSTFPRDCRHHALPNL